MKLNKGFQLLLFPAWVGEPVSRFDITAGLTAAIISLPLAITFGTISGLGPAAGIYGSVILGIVASLFGGTKSLITEPTGPMTVMATALVIQHRAMDPNFDIYGISAIILLAGIFQFLFGYVKLGKYITMMPYPVISGFMTGIGVLLVLQQVPGILGIMVQGTNTWERSVVMVQQATQLNGFEVIIGVSTLLILLFYPKSWKKLIPPHVPALLIVTILSATVFRSWNISTIGVFEIGLPRFRFPWISFPYIRIILVESILLALLGSIDTLLTAMISDSLTRNHHDSDRELMGQGIANVTSGLFGGLPGAGATMGTVVTIQNGSKSPAAGLFRGLFLFICVTVLHPWLRFIPSAAIAAIGIKVGLDILDWSFIRKAHKISLSTFVIMISVLVVTVFIDLLVAVGVGVFIANVLTIEKISGLAKIRVSAIDTSGGEISLTQEEQILLERHQGSMVLMHFSGPMIFGIGQAMAREASSLEQSMNVLILDMTDVTYMDSTIALSISNMIKDANDKKTKVYMSGLKERDRNLFTTLNLLEMIQETGTRLEGLQLGSKEIIHRHY
jgi:SulP family sulfate permease